MIPKQSLLLLGILLLATEGALGKGAFEQILDVNLGKGDLCCLRILEIILIIEIKKMIMKQLGLLSRKLLFCYSFVFVSLRYYYFFVSFLSFFF